MTLGDTLERVAPYAERALDSDQVREGLDRMVAASRDAYARGRNARHARDAVADRRLRQRVREATQAAREVVEAIAAGPQIQRRRRRRGFIIVGLAGAAGAAMLAVHPETREKLSGWIDGGGPAATAGDQAG